MMFGFGDDQNPYTESVDLIEDLVIEYISEMVGSVSFIYMYYENHSSMSNTCTY